MSTEVHLHATTDAQVWTKEWLRIIKEHPEIPTDEGTMITWFANALQTGEDHFRNRRMSGALEDVADEFSVHPSSRPALEDYTNIQDWVLDLAGRVGSMAHHMRRGWKEFVPGAEHRGYANDEERQKDKEFGLRAKVVGLRTLFVQSGALCVAAVEWCDRTLEDFDVRD